MPRPGLVRCFPPIHSPCCPRLARRRPPVLPAPLLAGSSIPHRSRDPTPSPLLHPPGALFEEIISPLIEMPLGLLGLVVFAFSRFAHRSLSQMRHPPRSEHRQFNEVPDDMILMRRRRAGNSKSPASAHRAKRPPRGGKMGSRVSVSVSSVAAVTKASGRVPSRGLRVNWRCTPFARRYLDFAALRSI